MDIKNLKLDIVNLKKPFLYSLAIGVGLGVIAGLSLYTGDLWGIILICAWIFCGCLYANAFFKFRAGGFQNSSVNGTGELLNIGLNGAVLAAVAEIIYNVLLGIIYSIRVRHFTSLLSISGFLEAAIIGAFGAIIWFLYKTNKR
jgi:hypothetical protein